MPSVQMTRNGNPRENLNILRLTDGIARPREYTSQLRHIGGSKLNSISSQSCTHGTNKTIISGRPNLKSLTPPERECFRKLKSLFSVINQLIILAFGNLESTICQHMQYALIHKGVYYLNQPGTRVWNHSQPPCKT